MKKKFQPSALSHQPCKGFTLIELINVLGIMVFLMAIAVGSYMAWNQTSALRGAADLTLSGLNRARQFAVTHRVDTLVWMQNAEGNTLTNRAFFAICTNTVEEIKGDVIIVSFQYLPVNISYGHPDDAPRFLCFKSNGRVHDNALENDLVDLNDDGEITLDLCLRRGQTFVTQTLVLDPLTGHARPEK
ncbi:MAG: type II secretion system GspH family protein [Kiritimatiellaeota bacterium]|nr:type II secretion system GspH family protein [Kiritimatiellota bacterium]